jgi:hypothetical protein
MQTESCLVVDTFLIVNEPQGADLADEGHSQVLHDGARSHVVNLCGRHRFVGAEHFRRSPAIPISVGQMSTLWVGTLQLTRLRSSLVVVIGSIRISAGRHVCASHTIGIAMAEGSPAYRCR